MCKQNLLVALFLFAGSLPIAAASESQSNTDKGSGTKSESTSENASSPQATQNTGVSPDTSDIGAWVTYEALNVGAGKVAGVLRSNTAVCKKYTFVTPADRIAALAVARQVPLQVDNLLAQACRVEEGLKLAPTEGCPPPPPLGEVPKAFLPGIAALATFATSAATVVQFTSSLKPTYSPKSGVVTIDAVALQRSLINAIGPDNVVGINPSMTGADLLISKIRQIAVAKEAIDKAKAPEKANEAEKKKWDATQSDASAALSSFLTVVNDPTKAFIRDYVVAQSVVALNKDACYIAANAHAGATNVRARTHIFSADSIYETGNVVVSYDIQKPDGNYLAAGFVIVVCELGSTYELGGGTPPDPQKLVCKSK